MADGTDRNAGGRAVRRLNRAAVWVLAWCAPMIVGEVVTLLLAGAIAVKSQGAAAFADGIGLVLSAALAVPAARRIVADTETPVSAPR